MFAITNKIGIGTAEFKLPLPNTILEIANVFRASGRMFWPVFYVIVFASIYLVAHHYKKRTAVSLLGFALAVQVVDLHAAWSGIRKGLMVEPSSTWSTALVDPFWDVAAAKYTKVRWLPPTTYDDQRRASVAYAGTHQLPIDAAYLARTSNLALSLAVERADASLHGGQYDADSLYFIDKESALLAAMNLNSNTDVFAKIDNMFVVAPGWKQCVDCPTIKGETTYLTRTFHKNIRATICGCQWCNI